MNALLVLLALYMICRPARREQLALRETCKHDYGKVGWWGGRDLRQQCKACGYVHEIFIVGKL